MKSGRKARFRLDPGPALGRGVQREIGAGYWAA